MWQDLLRHVPKPKARLEPGITTPCKGRTLRLELVNMGRTCVEMRLGSEQRSFLVYKDSATALAAYFTHVAEQLEE